MNFLLLTRLFEVTGSAISTSLLWVSYALPAMIIGPFASGITDLVDKRMILIATNFLQSLTIFIFALELKSSIFIIYEVVLIYSFLNQFYIPSETATLPSVLSKKELVQGNSLFFITQQGSLVLGLGIAGILNNLLGFKDTLFLCSFFVLIAFVSTFFLPGFPSTKIASKKVESTFLGFFRHLDEGYNFIKNEKRVLVPFLLLLGFQVMLQLCVVQFPILAKDLLKVPLNAASILVIVPAGLGAFLGALILPKMLKRELRKKTTIDISLSAIGISLLFLVFVLPVLGYVFKIILDFTIFVVLGFAFVGILVPAQAFLQEFTPSDFRGRVFGNFSFLVTIAAVLPVVFSGSAVEVFGIRFLLFILSIIVLGVYVFSKKFGDRFLTV